MSEVLYDGPIDKQRQTDSLAQSIGAAADKYISEDVKRLNDFNMQIAELDQSSPLFNQDVTIYGTELVPNTSYEESFEPLVVLPEDRLSEIAGLYQGYVIKPAYDPISQRTVYYDTHVIQMWSSNFHNRSGLVGTIGKQVYVRVKDSEIVPKLPVNAHSLKDLEGDLIVEEFNDLIQDINTTRTQKLKLVGRLSSKFLVDIVFDNQRNHQLVSYFNSKHLLKGITVLTKDLTVNESDKSGYYQKADVSGLEILHPVKPMIFTIKSGYTRSKNAGAYQNGIPELFVCGLLNNGQKTAAPLNNILGIEWH